MSAWFFVALTMILMFLLHPFYICVYSFPIATFVDDHFGKVGGRVRVRVRVSLVVSVYASVAGLCAGIWPHHSADD